MNPLAQTFFVPQALYPHGVFITSVDLCFQSKAVSTLPVILQIRPTVNGFPSSGTILPFSTVVLTPDQVKVSSSPSLDNPSTVTSFVFRAPVYLNGGGEYAIIVMSNDPGYDLYTAILGQNILGTTRIVSQQPYSGNLFKSSNATTYEPILQEDMMFRIHKAVFPVGVTGTITYQANSAIDTYFDTMYLQEQQISYTQTSISWAQKTTPNATFTIDGNFTNIIPQQNIDMTDGAGRRIIKAVPTGENGKYYAQASLVTFDANVSPIIDSTRVSLLAIQNFINNDATNETGISFGNALARYISRTVQLAPGFDSNSLQVYIDAYKPQNTQINVYYKILSRDDPDIFANKSWQLLPQLTSTNSYSVSTQNIIEYKYASSAINDAVSYTSNSVTYTSFYTFAIKVVLLSPDTTLVPQLHDIRVIALPAQSFA